MPNNDLDKLAALLMQERDAVLSRWRQEVRKISVAEHLDTPTLNNHIPLLIEELAAALRSRSEETLLEALSETTPSAHGLQRLHEQFDLEEVVSEYNILRGCIHELADVNGLILQGKAFHIVNRVLDVAIGWAVHSYSTQKALEVKQRREEYLTFVAHDLRTPLNAISLAMGALEEALPKQAPGGKNTLMFEIIRRNVRNLNGLIGKVLEENSSLLPEIEKKLERRTFDLWPFIEGLLLDLRPAGETGGARLINEVPHDLTVYADAGLLRRVFQNLIANATRYTPSGEVIVSARETGAEGEVECQVSDNGMGIPAKRLAKIFDKFETDPEKEGGLGLGLAIVKKFVEAHGGKVSVESKQGLGSTFRFTFPSRPR